VTHLIQRVGLSDRWSSDANQTWVERLWTSIWDSLHRGRRWTKSKVTCFSSRFITSSSFLTITFRTTVCRAVVANNDVRITTKRYEAIKERKRTSESTFVFELKVGLSWSRSNARQSNLNEFSLRHSSIINHIKELYVLCIKWKGNFEELVLLMRNTNLLEFGRVP